jgi:hypothetical protein
MKFIKPAATSNPEHTGLVFINGKDRIPQIAGIFRFVPVTGKFILFLIKYIDPPAVGSNPEDTGLVCKNGCNSIMTQRERVGGFVFITGKDFFFSVKPIDTSPPGTDPQRTGLVFKYF